MNYNFKKLFLLPSLLLTQAYCLENCVELNNTTNLDKYSEKIKINSDEINHHEVINEQFISEIKKEILSKNNYILLSIVSINLLILILKNKKNVINNGLNNFLIFCVKAKTKIQKIIFESIKSIKKSFHSNYQKIYYFSFVY